MRSCDWCGAELVRKTYADGSLETLFNFKKRITCGRDHAMRLNASRQKDKGVVTRSDRLKTWGHNDVIHPPSQVPDVPAGYSERMMRGALV